MLFGKEKETMELQYKSAVDKWEYEIKREKDRFREIEGLKKKAGKGFGDLRKVIKRIEGIPQELIDEIGKLNPEKEYATGTGMVEIDTKKHRRWWMVPTSIPQLAVNTIVNKKECRRWQKETIKVQENQEQVKENVVFLDKWISEFKVMQREFSTYLTKISSLSMRKNVYDVWTTDEKESLKILIVLAFLMESKIQEDLHGSYDGI